MNCSRNYWRSLAVGRDQKMIGSKSGGRSTKGPSRSLNILCLFSFTEGLLRAMCRDDYLVCLETMLTTGSRGNRDKTYIAASELSTSQWWYSLDRCNVKAGNSRLRWSSSSEVVMERFCRIHENHREKLFTWPCEDPETKIPGCIHFVG